MDSGVIFVGLDMWARFRRLGGAEIGLPDQICVTMEQARAAEPVQLSQSAQAGHRQALVVGKGQQRCKVVFAVASPRRAAQGAHLR